MSVIQRIGAFINDAVTTLFSTWSSTKIASEIAAATAADYASDYYVSDDIGDDTNTGLNEAHAFKTLEKALDTGEAGGVPYAIHILDDSSYEVQAASGTRTDTIEFVIHNPTGTIAGPAGGLIWEVPKHQIMGHAINGENLIFTPSTTSVKIQHLVNKIIDPAILYQSLIVAHDNYQIQLIVNEVLGIPGICNLTERGKIDFNGNFVAGVFPASGGQRSLFKASGTNVNMFIRAGNLDCAGSGTRRVIDAEDGSNVYVVGHCSNNSPTFAIVDGASTKLFAINVDSSLNTPETFTVTGGATVVSSSPQEGLNFADLDATGGLDLADLINVRDISTGEQVKATLTDLQTIFAGAFVTIATTQTVSGTKTFIAPVTVQDGTGSGLAANSIADCFVFTSSNVNAGMSMMTVAGGNANFFFGETGNSNKAAHIQYIGSVNELRLGASNVNVQRISGTNVLFETKIQVRDGGVFRFDVETDGTLTVGDTANYETLVTDDDDIPNKKYVDDAAAAVAISVVTKAFADSPYSTANGEIVLANAVGGAMQIDLPAATLNDKVTVKKTDASVNVVTIDGSGGETIDGALTASLSAQYESITLVSDGSNWFII